jgi:hypothetical protein
MSARGGLRRFASAAPAPPVPVAEAPEKCEMCGNLAGYEHGHVVDVENRALMCACRACYLLFTGPAAGGRRYRAVPDRYLHDPEHPITPAEWDALGIPVSSAFVLRGDSGPTAFYPSPAGATECLLNLEALADLSVAHPLLAAVEPEVEAILIHSVDHGVESFLVPVDACYQLVGTVRMYWKGFDGGEEAHQHVDRFFDQIRAKARRYEPGA